MELYLSDTDDVCYNLAMEEWLFTNYKGTEPIIFLWQSRQAIVCGCYQNVYAEADVLKAYTEGVTVIRRITGGGTVFHDLGNVNYSLIYPDAEALDYASCIKPITDALNNIGIPAVHSGVCDITVDGKKVSGSAQKSAGGRLLHHGTLLYDSDLVRLKMFANGRRSCYSTKGIASNPSPVTNMRPYLGEQSPDTKGFMELLQKQFSEVSYSLYSPANEILSLSNEKYRSFEWNLAKSPAYIKETELGTISVKKGIIESLTVHDDKYKGIAEKLIGMKLDPKELWYLASEVCELIQAIF